MRQFEVDRCHLFLYLIILLTSRSSIASSEANNGSSTTLSDLGGIAAGTCYFEVKESDFIITWQLEGAPVFRHDSNDYSSKVVGRHTSTIGENGRVAELSIADITFEDSGTYTCAKSYLVEGLPEEYKWILHVQGKPEIEQKNIPVESENDVVAECCLQYSNHHYHPTFSWLIDNKTFPIRTSTPRYTYHHGIYTTCNAISFVSKRSYNSGTLECLIIGSGPVSARTKLNSLLEADVDLMHQKTMEVSQNHIVILVCQASGFPIPNVNLQRINTLYEWESLSYQPHINESESLWWYELKEYSDRDAYRCLANNTVDEFATSEVVVLSVIGGINPLPTDSTQLLLIMLISSVAVVFFICILIILVCKKYLLSLGDDTGFTRNTDTVTVDSGKKKTENLDTVELYCTIPNDTGTVNNDTMLLIPEKDLTFGKQLKRSALRQRWKGNFRKESSVIDVHVSSCRCDQQETDEWTSFIRCIRQLPSHTNIVKLLGQCVRVDTTYCVHEDLSYGTLRSYLESEYGESFQSYTTLEPVPSKFFSLAIGATLGMKHLHFHRWIHPGLCARKVLLTQGGKSCKLYDFCSPEFAGVRIEAEIQECNPYVNIPSEVLAQKEYTQMSDIWAVGVLIWELFSYGAHLPTHKEVAQNERHGMELCKPEKCPKNIYDAILDSWKHDPRSRPTLMELEHEMTQASAFYALNTDNKAVCSSFKVPNVTDQ
ncbi:uncharacterized protein [Apostichopus japonicus]|uniref:uncharacterized protein isoform X2 n=1 Tax=Stichopus japonicus TaxID=307972 RepID=UPI003AB84F78